jgi:hypothetical protein
MPRSVGALPRLVALLGLFLGGAVAGIILAKTLAPGSCREHLTGWWLTPRLQPTRGTAWRARLGRYLP